MSEKIETLGGVGFAELVSHNASDLDIVNAARVSYAKESPKLSERDKKLIGYLMRNRHGSPFEHAVFRFRVKAPLFVVAQWQRHRMASYNQQCLSGSTIVTRLYKNQGGTLHKKNSALEVIWRNWHHGVTDTLGRKPRLLSSCRNIYVRSYDETTLEPVKSRVIDVKKQGVQCTYLVSTESGRQIRATMNHKFFTPNGWSRLSDLTVGDYLYRSGLVREDGEPRIPLRLRQGIQEWTTQQKQLLIPRSGTTCYLCGTTLEYNEVELDHEIPVVKDLTRALDESNLKPACKSCHRTKSNGEQKFADRAGIARGLRFDRITSIDEPLQEQTYDLVLEGPHHNFLANGLVVHNSARWSEMPEEFYMPEPEIEEASAFAYLKYRAMLARGVPKERARIALPVGTMTAFWFTVNSRSLMNFLMVRNEEHAQEEIREYARALEHFFGLIMPGTFAAFVENGRIAP